MKKHILIICDGLGDLPVPELGEKTPLEAANTPNMDRMAKNGVTGLMHVLGEGVRPNSDDAHLAILGYNLETEYPGRGQVEAAGLGMVLEEGDIAFRCNLAYVDDELRVIDRRAGRIDNVTPFVESFNGIEIDGIKFLVKPGTGYRMVVVMRGKGLSDKISNSDVHYVTEGQVVEDWEGKKVNIPHALDDSLEAKFTAEVLQKFLEKAHDLLEKNPLNIEKSNKGEPKGNYILTRGPGYYKKLPTFAQKWGLNNAGCIAGAGMYKGIGILTGMDLIFVPGATGEKNTDLIAKINFTRDKIKNYDFLFLHIKLPDIYGHDGDFLGKKAAIEKIDKAIDNLESTGAVIAVTADHSTPCSHKDHSADPVPLLIAGRGIEPDDIKKFGESFCKKGSLGTIQSKDFMKLFLGY